MLAGWRYIDVAIISTILAVQLCRQGNVVKAAGNYSTARLRSRDHFRLSYEGRLVRYLTKRYKRAGNFARPLLNSSDVMKVQFSLALIQILDFDETNQVLTTNVWKRYRWVDEILTWDPKDFGGLDDIRLPSSLMWTPDIVLYNNADEQVKKHDELMAVYHTGLIRWIPPAIYKSACQLDMRNFPFDEQTCHFKFGSWTYDGNKLDLVFYDNLVDLDIREFIDSSEWKVMNTSARYNRRMYPCCGDEPYPDLTFYLTVKRRTAFYVYVLILPSVLLSFLTLVLFWIPPQRPDRTSLGMSLFSSFFVLLLILVQSSPPTSASISLLGMYYCINMILIAISTMVSAVVINMTHYLQRSRVPKWLKLVCLNGCARLLCANTELLFREECKDNDTPSLHSNGSKKSRQLHTGNPDSYCQRNLQWRAIAQVIDRVFFIFYAVGIVLSFIFVFPR